MLPPSGSYVYPLSLMCGICLAVVLQSQTFDISQLAGSLKLITMGTKFGTIDVKEECPLFIFALEQNCVPSSHYLHRPLMDGLSACDVQLRRNPAQEE